MKRVQLGDVIRWEWISPITMNGKCRDIPILQTGTVVELGEEFATIEKVTTHVIPRSQIKKVIATRKTK